MRSDYRLLRILMSLSIVLLLVGTPGFMPPAVRAAPASPSDYGLPTIPVGDTVIGGITSHRFLQERSTVYLPLVAKPCLPAYRDDFSNPASGWPVVDNANYAMGYLNGEYRIQVKPANWMAYLSDDFGSSDFRVEVDARPAAHLDGGVALIFSRTDSGYYLFEVSDGWFILLRHDSRSGTWTTLLDWTSSPAIRAGSQTNHLKVVRAGTNVSLYVNGQLVGGTNDSTYTGAGLGIATTAYSANFDGRFDNFAVYTDACAGAAAALSPNRAASFAGPAMEHGSDSR